MRRFGLLLGVCAGLMLSADAGMGQGTAKADYDILIKNARILDGTGSPFFSGIIAVSNGHIAAIGNPGGPLSHATARKVIDAKGLVASPGFIDLHTHSETSLLADGNAESMIRDGVTTNVAGEQSSVVPRDGLPVEGEGAVKQDWSTVTGYFARLKKSGTSINVIVHIAENQVRRVVMGYAEGASTPAQQARMDALMARSMRECPARWPAPDPPAPRHRWP